MASAMKSLIWILLGVLTCLVEPSCSNQHRYLQSKQDLKYQYKMYFLVLSVSQFQTDTTWRDRVCTYVDMPLDDRSMFEIDSFRKEVASDLWENVANATEHVNGDYWPTEECIFRYSLRAYESADLERMAKRYVRRTLELRKNQ